MLGSLDVRAMLGIVFGAGWLMFLAWAEMQGGKDPCWIDENERAPGDW